MLTKFSVSAFIVATLATAGLARDHKIAPDLADCDKCKIIVKWENAPTEADHDKIRMRGGSLRSVLRLIKAGAYTVDAATLQHLANDRNVRSIHRDHSIFPTLDVTAATVRALPANVGNGIDGSGAGVAVIDSGIGNSLDFSSNSWKSRIVYAESFVPGQASTDDVYGHGTHIAGIIAGNGTNSSLSQLFTRTFRGIAPKVNLINLRVLDQDGAGSDAAVIAAIDRAIELKSTYNIRVINLSLGRPIFESWSEDPLCDAIQKAWDAGIVVVVAAGNYGREKSLGNWGYGTIAAPGNSPYAITVGAMKTNGTADKADDAIASYSSKGPTFMDHIVKPDLVAPGNLIVSVRANGTDRKSVV